MTTVHRWPRRAAIGTVLLVLVTIVSAQALEPEVAPDEILVRLPQALDGMLDDGSFPLSTGLAKVDAAIDRFDVDRIEYALPVSARSPGDPLAFRRHGLDRTYRFRLSPGSDVRAVAAVFDALEEVEYAEPNYIGEDMATVPDDSLFSSQWHLDQARDADIDAPEAWDLSTGSPSVVIGIADTGIDIDHVDLDETLWTNPGEISGNGIDDDGNGYVDDVHGWNFATGTGNVDDNDGHGTWVASLAVAESNNAQGIAGVCWTCRTMVTVRAANTHADYADSVIWAADHGAQIVNGSWGDALTGSSTLASAVGYIADLGVVQVNSAGNSPQFGVSWPAGYVETIAVSATTDRDQQWSSSSSGPEVDVCAAGNQVLGAYFDGDYIAGDGTSASSPITAGIAGLVLSLHPSVGRDEVRHLLRSGAEDEISRDDPPGFDDVFGWGRVNASNTLQAARSANTLHVDGKTATRLTLGTANPVADSYDFARGNLHALRENPYGVELGALTCLENDSIDADTLGFEDAETPAPGEGFFYVSRFNAAPGSGPYGGSSRHRDRLVFDNTTDASWIFDGEQEGESSQIVRAAGDVNGDGYGDLAIGSVGYDSPLQNAGRVRVFYGSASGPSESPDWIFVGDLETANVGLVATAGDVNGDGFDDLLVGARGYAAGETREGRVWLFLGSSVGLEAEPAWTFDGNQEGAQLGMVSTAGDVNADGFDDILVGAVAYDVTFVDEGRVFLFLGGPDGPSTTPAWTFDGGQQNPRMEPIAGGGDVDGDGFSDLLIGAYLYDDGQTNEGAVFVFLGSDQGLSLTPDYVFEGNQADARFGFSVNFAGDVDADGYDDILIGAIGYGSGGAAFLHLGGPDGPDATADWVFESDQAGAGVGFRASPTGDLDGDGHDDIVVTANQWNDRRQEEGRAWVFLGSTGGVMAEPVWSRTSRQSFAGWRIAAGLGDLDGDGSPEFGIGTGLFDVFDLVDAGRVWIYEWPLSMESPDDCPR